MFMYFNTQQSKDIYSYFYKTQTRHFCRFCRHAFLKFIWKGIYNMPLSVPLSESRVAKAIVKKNKQE